MFCCKRALVVAVLELSVLRVLLIAGAVECSAFFVSVHATVAVFKLKSCASVIYW